MHQLSGGVRLTAKEKNGFFDNPSSKNRDFRELEPCLFGKVLFL